MSAACDAGRRTNPDSLGQFLHEMAETLYNSRMSVLCGMPLALVLTTLVAAQQTTSFPSEDGVRWVRGSGSATRKGMAYWIPGARSSEDGRLVSA